MQTTTESKEVTKEEVQEKSLKEMSYAELYELSKDIMMELGRLERSLGAVQHDVFMLRGQCMRLEQSATEERIKNGMEAYLRIMAQVALEEERLKKIIADAETWSARQKELREMKIDVQAAMQSAPRG
jgi:hypothetical protein